MSMDDWGPDRMMNGSYGGGMYGGAWMMLVVGLLLLAAVIATVLLATRLAGPHHQQGRSPIAGPSVGSPRDVLDQRLARGELTPEEYRATRSLLET